MRLQFYIDGHSLKDFAIVTGCSGLLSIPKTKELTSADDPQSHGKMYDLSAKPKYQEREITLNCQIVSVSRSDVFRKIGAINALFSGSGTHRLTAIVDGVTQVAYEVIRKDGATVSPAWDGSKNLAKFDIKLVEPCPVKKILTVTNTGNVTIGFTTSKFVTISWGDGTYSRDLSGTISLTKSIPASTQILIIGDVEEMTNFTNTNSVIQWDILF